MKIICIGRNYVEHIAELGNERPSEPVIFMKPDTALLRNNEPFFIPSFSNDVHHEVEIVVKIKKEGKSIDKEIKKTKEKKRKKKSRKNNKKKEKAKHKEK